MTSNFQGNEEFLKVEKLLERKSKEIDIIKKVSNQINKTLNLNTISKSMQKLMDDFFGFKHSMILLFDEKNENLKVLSTYGYENKGKGATVKLGVGVIGMVAKRKKLIRMSNMGMQRSYMNAIKTQVQQNKNVKLDEEEVLPGLEDVESQVAIPMLIDNELVGVFSVESNKVNIFDKSDEEIISILSNQTANALHNARLYQLEQNRLKELNNAHSKLEHLNLNLEKKVEERTSELMDLSNKLSKYFSPQVYDSIFSGKLDVKIQTQRKPLTVFFSDLQGFTELTERLEPEILTELLTQYLTSMSEIAVKWGGTIDKFIGDAILIFFGDPISKGNKEDALNCVFMALEMLSELENLRNLWRDRGISNSLNARIGIHTGVCTVGNFGSEDRLDYTIIGNGVNLASRLESNAGTNKILISEDSYLLIREKINCKKMNKLEVKGMSFPVQTYEVLSLKKNLLNSDVKINEQIPGLSLKFDKKELKSKEHALKIIDNLLKTLKN